MGKKRKHSEAEAATREKEEEVAPERPKRTLSGWKENKDDQVNQTESATFFRNKEKVLVTCSRRNRYSECCAHNRGIEAYWKSSKKGQDLF
ncbi:hypothetical protein L3X38_030867 [Prunus dulcis]|uniref:Uncharacterized protein n=1 Tax=Prunus dulcis TaxID=3755 RepID=A0AAD4VD90_PRUDU|nr:hypothetical protein L3X38_030867 [Prunus dulcis]